MHICLYVFAYVYICAWTTMICTSQLAVSLGKLQPKLSSVSSSVPQRDRANPHNLLVGPVFIVIVLFEYLDHLKISPHSFIFLFPVHQS